MKKLMMIAAMMLMSVGAFAQEAGEMYIKPMVGATFTTITNSDHAKFKFGLVGGAEFGYQISDPFAITAGALYSMQGAKADDVDGTKDYTNTITYINIPILANYYIFPGFAIKAGLQPGFLVSAKTKYTAGGHDVEVTGTDSSILETILINAVFIIPAVIVLRRKKLDEVIAREQNKIAA